MNKDIILDALLTSHSLCVESSIEEELIEHAICILLRLEYETINSKELSSFIQNVKKLRNL